MSILINNFTDIDYLYELYDSSYCIIFSNRDNIDISLCNTDLIIFDLYDELIPIRKSVWRETNKACYLLANEISSMISNYSITNNIWNIFFIDYMMNNRPSDGELLIMENDISGIFGIYDKKHITIDKCKCRLFFSSKLKTFVLYDVFESEMDNNKYIVGQLMSHLKVDYPNISFKDVSNGVYKCPISWRKFSGNTFGICKNSERPIIKPWLINNEMDYYPIHILSELKVLYVWLILLFKYMNGGKKSKRDDYKKITYIFSDIEYEKLKKYAKDENIIEYILDGYLKFVGIKWQKEYILYEVNVDNNKRYVYPLVPTIDDYDVYKKSKWMNNWVKRWKLCNKIDKILVNIFIEDDIENSELKKREDILIQIDIGLNKDGRLVNIVYMEESDDMMKWKKMLDNFLNMWVK